MKTNLKHLKAAAWTLCLIAAPLAARADFGPIPETAFDSSSPFDVLKAYFENAKPIRLSDLPRLGESTTHYACTYARANTRRQDLRVEDGGTGPARVRAEMPEAAVPSIPAAGPLFPEIPGDDSKIHVEFAYFGSGISEDVTHEGQLEWGEYFRSSLYALISASPLVQKDGFGIWEYRISGDGTGSYSLKDTHSDGTIDYYMCWKTDNAN